MRAPSKQLQSLVTAAYLIAYRQVMFRAAILPLSRLAVPFP